MLVGTAMCMHEPRHARRQYPNLALFGADNDLKLDFCAVFDQEEYVCNSILGAFCSFCKREKDGRTNCVTHNGERHAEEGTSLCAA